MSLFVFFFSYLYVSISWVGEERTIFLISFTTCNYVFFSLPLDAWHRLRYFIVALPVPSI